MKVAATVRGNAHLALAGIRLVMGTGALLAPRVLAKRLDIDARESPGLLYFQRMFGIRTICLALDLVDADKDHKLEALRRGAVIHAGDATVAAFAGMRGVLAPRAAVLATAVSLVNLLLALVARPR